MFRKDFQDLARTRLRDAKLLLAGGAFDGAYYLGGLAVENALKACIARTTQRYEFPDRNRVNRLYSHNLEGLLKEAELDVVLKSAPVAVLDAWAKTKEWHVDARYLLGKTESEATNFVQAVGGRQGVLLWVRRFW
jgi:HEPN domain-containing protein